MQLFMHMLAVLFQIMFSFLLTFVFLFNVREHHLAHMLHVAQSLI